MTQFMKPRNDAAAQRNAMMQLMIERPLVLAELTAEQQDDLTVASFGGELMFRKPTASDIVKKGEKDGSGNTYSFKSGGVIGMLSDMVDKFKAKSAEATRDESFRLSQHMNQQGARDDA